MSLVCGRRLDKYHAPGNGVRKRKMRRTASRAAIRQVQRTAPAEVVHHFGAWSTQVCSRILHDPTCALPPPTQSSNRWPPDWPNLPPTLPQWVNAGQSSAMNLPRMPNTLNETCALLNQSWFGPKSVLAKVGFGQPTMELFSREDGQIQKASWEKWLPTKSRHVETKG